MELDVTVNSHHWDYIAIILYVVSKPAIPSQFSIILKV